MPVISFRLVKHTIKPVEIVEILRDGVVVGTVCPTEEGIKIVSAHMDKILSSDGVGQIPPIPHMEITFDPKPYRIEGGKLVRETTH